MTPQDTKEFRNASDRELLLHATGYPAPDDPEGIAIVAGAREELGALAALMEISQPGAEINLADIGGTLEQIANRLDVALALLGRAELAEDMTPALERLEKKLEDAIKRLDQREPTKKPDGEPGAEGCL